MTTRESLIELEVSDVMPGQLRRNNRRLLLDRLKSYRRLYHAKGATQVILDHSESMVGSYTILVAALEAAGSDVDVRRQWAAVETWADEWGVTLT